MSGYPFFIPGFVLCTNSSLFWFKIANKLSEFRNYLYIIEIISQKHKIFLNSMASTYVPIVTVHSYLVPPSNLPLAASLDAWQVTIRRLI